MNLSALVLTAGLGTRLRPLTYVRAKAAVPVNGETLARRAVRWLVSHGVTDLVLNLHHHPASITASVGDGCDLGARVRYSWEQPVLGSAGGPRHALPLLLSPNGRSTAHSRDTFIIVNGDTLTNVDLAAMRRRHAETGALVTMAVIPNPEPDKYGGVLLDDAELVAGFTRAGAVRESYHFIGVQFAERGAFAGLADGVPAESVNALYPALMAARPGSVAAFACDATFQDIGTPADYLHTCVQLARTEGDNMIATRNVRIGPAAVVRGSAVWDDVVIGAHATLVDCIIADGARIPDDAHYERCTIVPAGHRTAAAGERIENGLLIAPLD
jgi:NDP-sugar pyrophosphorylase family protein